MLKAMLLVSGVTFITLLDLKHRYLRHVIIYIYTSSYNSFSAAKQMHIYTVDEYYFNRKSVLKAKAQVHFITHHTNLMHY